MKPDCESPITRELFSQCEVSSRCHESCNDEACWDQHLLTVHCQKVQLQEEGFHQVFQDVVRRRRKEADRP